MRLRLPDSFPLLLGVFVGLAALYERKQGSRLQAQAPPTKLVSHRGRGRVVTTSKTSTDSRPPEPDELLREAVLTVRATGGWDLSFEGSPIGRFDDREQAIAAWRATASRKERWVNLYEADERGGLCLLDERGDVVQRW